MLFSPLTIGQLEAPNRLVMAPLTRLRSGREGIPGPLVVEHYRQRASLGLIVSEGTYPSPAGRGFPGQPGLVTEEQLKGWADVTAAVHEEGGRIFAQVMHAGRVTRDDNYGGSPENRARFVIEVAQAVVDAIGADRVGIRISPEHNVQGALELDAADVRETYGYLVDALAPLKLAYLSVLHKEPTSELVQDLRTRFAGTFLVNTGFGVITTAEEAKSLVSDGHTDGVVVGRPAIANPDLVRRWREGLPVNEPDQATFYTDGAEGYTDYPAYQN